MIFCTNIRAIYYTSLRSRRSEVTGARKNGTRAGDTRGEREMIFMGLSKGGLCSLPMMHCAVIYYRIGLWRHHFKPVFFLHPFLSSFYYTDKTADHIPSSSAHKPDIKRDTHVFSDLEQGQINLARRDKSLALRYTCVQWRSKRAINKSRRASSPGELLLSVKTVSNEIMHRENNLIHSYSISNVMKTMIVSNFRHSVCSQINVQLTTKSRHV